MSVLVLAWVFANSPTKLGDRLVLLALADYAHDDGSRAFPSVESLATKARVGKSTARSALRRLESEGHIISEGATPSGTISYRVLMGAPESGGGQNRAEGGPESGANPSKEPSPKKNAGERAKAAAQSLPDEFPEHLRPHAQAAFRILRSLAQQYNAKEVTPRALGHAILSAPGRRYVEEAHKMAAWCQSTDKPVVDVVSRYQRWLGNASTYSGVERVDGGQVVAIGNAPKSSRDLAAQWEAVAARNQAKQDEIARRSEAG